MITINCKWVSPNRYRVFAENLLRPLSVLKYSRYTHSNYAPYGGAYGYELKSGDFLVFPNMPEMDKGVLYVAPILRLLKECSLGVVEIEIDPNIHAVVIYHTPIVSCPEADIRPDAPTYYKFTGKSTFYLRAMTNDTAKDWQDGKVTCETLTFNADNEPKPEPESNVKVEAAVSDGKPTKSELMTTLNKERARIRREYKNLPTTCAKELERLYKAFGNLQRKEWKQTTEKMNVTKDGALDYLGMKSTRTLLEKVYSLRPNAQPINVTAEFEKLNTKVTR